MKDLHTIFVKILHEIGIETIRKGPFFGLGTSNWKINAIIKTHSK